MKKIIVAALALAAAAGVVSCKKDYAASEAEKQQESREMAFLTKGLEITLRDERPTEEYREKLAAALAAGKTGDDTRWDDSYWPLEHFTGADPEAWAARFHVWRMDWDKEFIRLYLDDELLNEIPLSKTVNGKGGSPGINPFHCPFYLLLNLALDTRVTTYDPSLFPLRFEIDYVRIYHRKQ